MKLWKDDLRICPKCTKPVNLNGEEKAECPHCHSRVWFFSFREMPQPPEIPQPRAQGLFQNPTTTALLAAAGLFGLIALVAVASGLLVSAVSSLAALGFAAFGFVRHNEARKVEDSLDHMSRIRNHGEIMSDRVKELTSRYNSLLRTGNTRIEYYYDEICRRAELERQEAGNLRDQARADRVAIQNVENRIYAMAERLIADHLKWVSNKLRADPESYQRNKTELSKAFDFVESVGYRLPKNIRQDALAKLKSDYAEKVRVQALKDEQRRIKQQMRDEEKIRREREQAVREAQERERELQRRLEETLRLHKDSHDAEVEELQRQLADAQASSERALSMAQLTKAGHVYVLSNIGSFGDGRFKVGMTRRRDPLDRVKELGDASVPFPFDVHAMFACDNAPKLEKLLHRDLAQYRMNRVNFRKEFFEVPLEYILEFVKKHHGQIEYIAEPEALEYRESQNITPDQLLETERELEELGVDFEETEEE